MKTKEKNTARIIRIVRRGEIYYVDFGIGYGSEQGGYRPALIVQNNVGNLHSPTTVVVPLSTQLKAMHMPTHIYLGKAGGLEKPSITLIEQIRCIDKERIKDYIGRLDDSFMALVDEGIDMLFGRAQPMNKPTNDDDIG